VTPDPWRPCTERGDVWFLGRSLAFAVEGGPTLRHMPVTITCFELRTY
jgi:hypothetical protein